MVAPKSHAERFFIVGLAFILDMARSMSVTSAGWERLVSGWGDPTSFSRISIFAAMTVPLTGLGKSFRSKFKTLAKPSIESCIVQMFFAWWVLFADSLSHFNLFRLGEYGI